MITICQLDTPVSAFVEFDEYVPVTITWPEYHRLLETPINVTYSSSGQLFELKFHPETNHIIEAVLVNATKIQRAHGSLRPTVANLTDIACWSGTANASTIDSHDLPRVTAYDDYLTISIDVNPPRTWVGVPPALCGLDDARRLVAICVKWNETDQEVVMVGR